MVLFNSFLDVLAAYQRGKGTKTKGEESGQREKLSVSVVFFAGSINRPTYENLSTSHKGRKSVTYVYTTVDEHGGCYE